MLVREVRYARWKAWRNVGLGALLTLGGLGLALATAERLPGLLVAAAGAGLVYVSRRPLLQQDALLRLTPTGVWTRELGWQRWEHVLVYLGKGSRGGQHNILIIQRLHELTPRFAADINALDIDRKEVQYWLDHHARQA